MSDHPHSPEPWRGESRYDDDDDITYRDLVDANGGTVVGRYVGLGESDFRRVLTCVNFLRGVSTEELEGLLRLGARLQMAGSMATTVVYPENVFVR